jgi:hypothetical protein
MALRKFLMRLFPTACAAGLAAGYVLAGQGLMVVPVVLVWLGWLFPAQCPVSILLAASVALAAGGVWAGAAPFLMWSAATLALASWDMVRWDSFLAGDLPVEAGTRLERKHYICLALALGPALLAAVAGRLIQIQTPFGGLVAIVLLAFLGLDRIWSWVKN